MAADEETARFLRDPVGLVAAAIEQLDEGRNREGAGYRHRI